jgi:hypothetical protein
VIVYVQERDHLVSAYFKDDKDRASSLRKGIEIRVIGSLRVVTGYAGMITLERCEFVELERIAVPPADSPVQATVASVEAETSSRNRAVEPGTDFSGTGVGKTPQFHIAKTFGFRWTPSDRVVIGGLHGTLNGIQHTWTFDNNLNPYFPAKYAPPPDVPGDYYFTIDNIKPGTPWTINVLYED